MKIKRQHTWFCCLAAQPGSRPGPDFVSPSAFAQSRLSRVLCLSILSLALSLPAYGHLVPPPPSDSTGLARWYGLKGHYGFVLVHSRELVPVRHSNPYGLELDLAWHKASAQAWESCHCYPRLGASLTFWDYDQPDILGYGAIGLFYIEPVFAPWRKASFSVRAGMGLAYQSKPYDPIRNPLNQSYSTYLVIPLQLGGSLNWRLSPQWMLDMTLVYNHFSNGGIREPNKGINWPTAALGVGRYLSPPSFINREKKDWRQSGPPQSRLDVAFFLAFKEPQSKLYLFSPGIEVKGSRQVGRINALTLGGEFMYDNGTRFQIAQAGREESPQMGGLAFGHEFLLGRFIFSQQLGVYLYKPYRVGDDLYQRYSLMFRASERISAGMSLKAHRHVADFGDLRLAWSF